MRIALLLVIAFLVVSCGGGHDDTITVYLKAHLGPEGPSGQIAPVLTPVERHRREAMSAAWQSILDIRVGPSPDERAHGFLDTIAPQTRLRHLAVVGGTATVDLAGREPDFYGSAAMVYTLTELPGIDRVRLRLDGHPCCFYGHDRRPIATTTRDALNGWQGQPCALRGGDDVRCRK
jgi:spore germination protein GerM